MNPIRQLLVKYEVNYIALALILPLSTIIIWLLKNTQLPGNDAANYLSSAVEMYHNFTEKGFFHGLVGCYLERGWRPILFPVFAVPFLLLFQGSLFATYAAVAVTMTIASVVYVYLLFREKLSSFSAVIASSLVVLLPLVQAQIIMFYAESALFPCVIGSIYHLIRSDYMRNFKHGLGFAILFSLAVMIRPIEAMTALGFTLLLYFFIGYYKKIFSMSDLLRIIGITFFAIFILFAKAIVPYLQLKHLQTMDGGVLDAKFAAIIYFGFIISGCIVIIGLLVNFFPILIKWWQDRAVIIANQCSRSYLIPLFSLTMFLIALWFFPAAFATLQWIFRTSMGDVASSTGSLTGASFSWDVLHLYIQAEGTLVVIGIFLTALIGSLCLSSAQRNNIILSMVFISLLLTIPFSFWEAFYTVQIVTRKLSVAFPALLMAMLLLSLQQGRWWRSRCCLVILLLLVQAGLVFSLIFTNRYTHPDSFLKDSIGYFVPQAVTLNPNPHHVVEEFLATESQHYGLHNIALEVDPGTPDARHFFVSEPIDPFLLSTMVLAAKAKYATSYPYFGDYSANNLLVLKQRYDAIFLSDSSENMVISKKAVDQYTKKFSVETSPSLKTFAELLLHCSQNSLASIGWKLGPCITIQSVDRGMYRGCLLLHFVMPARS